MCLIDMKILQRKYIMIYTLLYRSTILQNHIHRNIYIYTIGTVIYTIIHCILFSQYGDNIQIIKKYRNYLYALVVCDILYVKKKYNEMIQSIHEQEIKRQYTQNSKIEPIEPIESKEIEMHKYQHDTTKDKSGDDVCVIEPQSGSAQINKLNIKNDVQEHKRTIPGKNINKQDERYNESTQIISDTKCNDTLPMAETIQKCVINQPENIPNEQLKAKQEDVRKDEHESVMTIPLYRSVRK